MKTEQLYLQAFVLLEDLIAIPSFSGEEEKTAQRIFDFFTLHGIPCERTGNNVWAKNKYYDPSKPTLLLNSHHDTVRPNGRWTNNPFAPVLNGEKMIGLGVNDAGASLVGLAVTFIHFYRSELPLNIVFAATAEEEISGTGGIESVYPHFGKIDLAIVGEPTGMDVAVAERGLLVIDCMARGKSGHAARNEGENAIMNAMKDIEWFRTFAFDRVSPWLDKVSMNVTMINAGSQHNVIPAECTFTVDIRLNDCYTTEEVLQVLRENISCEIKPRSLRGRAKSIDMSHPLMQTALRLNKHCFGSPTSSDQALIPAPSIKMGPGQSSRSHTADEFILLPELRQGITGYIEFIEALIHIIQSEHEHETLAKRKNFG